MYICKICRRYCSAKMLFLALFFFSSIPGSINAQQTLNEETVNKVTRSTYEVVVEKPSEEGITYEKELPFELLPFHIRNSKYISIGTAFAISETTFVSAAHVFDLTKVHLLNKFCLRDHQGEIFPVDTVKKYSYSKDFIVFSIQAKKTTDYLDTNSEPSINTPVFAVGNAHGQGVIIRDGLYTSNTPEELNGAWNWIRFSAAASPGNSGGPLLDQSGKVIGVVIGSSKNENLNAALPIKEVLNASEKVAHFKSKMFYSIEIMEGVHYNTFSFEIDLPKRFKQLQKALVEQETQIGIALEKEFKQKYRSELFPHGKKSTNLLYNPYSSCFPRIIAKKKDGNWKTYSPKNITTSKLDNKGRVKFGNVFSTTYMQVRKPGNIDYETFQKDSKIFMDTLLKGFPLTRNFGPEKIPILSLGKADKDSLFTDDYQRIWQVRTWKMPFSDTCIVIYSLPVPAGNMVMMKMLNAGLLSGAIQDLGTMTDFFYTAYCGKLREWEEFLKLKKLLPKRFTKLSIEFDYGDYLKLISPRFSLEYNDDMLTVKPASNLDIYFTYFKEKDEVLWDIYRVLVSSNSNYHEYYNLIRHIRPIPELGRGIKNRWKKMVNREAPNDEKAYPDERERTGIKKVVSDDNSTDLSTQNQLYTLYYGIYEKQSDDFMEEKINKFSPAVKINE